MSSGSGNVKTRREARLEHRAMNEAKADEQDQKLSSGDFEKPSRAEVRRAKKPQREQVAEQRAATEIELARQAQIVPGEVEVELQRGVVPPLHVLNALAKQYAKGRRNDARDAANAAGKATFQHLIGKRDNPNKSRSSKMLDALQAQQQALKAAANKTE